MPQPAKLFLNAQWKHLVMLNFPIDPTILLPYVPKNTELDSFQGQTYVSLVAFMFLQTRVLGIAIPFHQNFEEVNLRFYVKRIINGQIRRGVVFIKEIVPKPAIAYVARTLYNENYIALPMKHQIAGKHYRYEWKHRSEWNYINVQSDDTFYPLRSDTLEEFITEHYFGYVKMRNGETTEYEVKHPSWQVASANDVDFKVNTADIYGKNFVDALAQKPTSVFVANGSAIEVYKGIRI